jgi:hypothetical protein
MLHLCPTVENTQLTLNLQTENKGSVVSGGELTIFLDGPTVDLGSVPNGSAVTDGECHLASRAVPGQGGPSRGREVLSAWFGCRLAVLVHSLPSLFLASQIKIANMSFQRTAF